MKTQPRNLILVPVSPYGTHHAPRGINSSAYKSIREAADARQYEIRDADTGELIKCIEI